MPSKLYRKNEQKKLKSVNERKIMKKKLKIRFFPTANNEQGNAIVVLMYFCFTRCRNRCTMNVISCKKIIQIFFVRDDEQLQEREEKDQCSV